MAALRVRHQDAHEFVMSLLKASGVSAPNAAIVAQGLVEADLRGVDSHGINRIPSYLARIRAGVLDPKAEPTLTQVTPVVAQVFPLQFFFSSSHLPTPPSFTPRSLIIIKLER
jgi:LDH2 family malate/lactate/ureidoglycolate dehydrogenase